MCIHQNLNATMHECAALLQQLAHLQILQLPLDPDVDLLQRLSLRA
jgi:hypothetical protein